MPFGLLFICLPFTCVEVSAEKSAPPVNGPSIPPHGLPATPAKSTSPRTMKGEGTAGSSQPTVLPGQDVTLRDDCQR